MQTPFWGMLIIVFVLGSFAALISQFTLARKGLEANAKTKNLRENVNSLVERNGARRDNLKRRQEVLDTYLMKDIEHQKGQLDDTALKNVISEERERVATLTKAITDSEVRDYAYTKSVYPGSIPTTLDELYIEYAIARQLIRYALFHARESWPEGKNTRSSLLLPPVEPIVAAGATLARAPKPGYTALMLLDALQPTGVSTLVLDPYSLAPALGATAGPLPVATVQLLEAGVLVSLGTIVCPIGRGRPGRKVLSYELELEDSGQRVSGEIESGQIKTIPFGPGKFGKLSLRPERGYDVGFGSLGRSGSLRVSGGLVGVIIDARGRPLILPADRGQQIELNQRWLWEIGTME